MARTMPTSSVEHMTVQQQLEHRRVFFCPFSMSELAGTSLVGSVGMGFMFVKLYVCSRRLAKMYFASSGFSLCCSAADLAIDSSSGGLQVSIWPFCGTNPITCLAESALLPDVSLLFGSRFLQVLNRLR